MTHAREANKRTARADAGPAELWTIEDLAHFLKKPTSWVYENYRDLFPFYRTGQAIRFDPEEIRNALRDRYHTFQ
jgi:hypothetical protein